MLPFLLLSSAALACGGLFCSPTVAPIDQAAEEIWFALDEEAGTVEMHIAIQWEGKSEDFAWILPVPDEPELFLSSPTVFRGLQLLTNPSFQALGDTRGRCGPIRLGCRTDLAFAESGRSTICQSVFT